MGQFVRVQLGANKGSGDRAEAGKSRFPFYRLNDATGRDEQVTQFGSSEEFQEALAMTDEHGTNLYDTSAVFRVSVEEIVANSPALFAEETLARRNPIPDNETFLQGLREDAIRQRYDRLVDRAGGDDLEAKYELAMTIATADAETQASIREMQGLTQPEGLRPFEHELRERKAQGLGPLSWNSHDVAQHEQAQAEYEARMNKEALDYLAEHEAGCSIQNLEEV